MRTDGESWGAAGISPGLLWCRRGWKSPVEQSVSFGRYRFDLETGCLWSGKREVKLTPKASAVLKMLLTHAGQPVRKEELFASVWSGTVVSDDALTSCIQELRRALADNAKQPRFIETRHRRGYQFVARVSEGAAKSAADSRMPAPEMRPPVRYAKSGALSIAYQVTGSGPHDLVLISGFVSHLQLDWAEPRHAHFLERLGSFTRLIRFDKRGTGLSDRPGGLPDLETRMDDVRAVMDAVGSERAILFGYSEGGPMSVLFAATYRERTAGLVLYGTYARRLASEDYPWGRTLEQRATYAAQIENEWGWAADMHSMCPSADAALARWWGERARAAASPGAARALIEMNSLMDVRSSLPAVRVPTLVLHRRGDRDSCVEEGRYVAERIRGATFIELAGQDHFVAIDPDQILDPVEAFVTGHQPVRAENRTLATILFVDIVESTTRKTIALGDSKWKATLSGFQGSAAGQIERHAGRLVKTIGDGLVGVFDGPARAVRCACVIRDLARAWDLGLRCGVHTAEIELRGTDIFGIGVRICARISQHADPGEVWVSRTVKDLVVGSGLNFEERGDHGLKDIDDMWTLYAAIA
jgi:DNA-binding winged helix-turn-helix (wHTH) protein/class 3 adenylate cyclase